MKIIDRQAAKAAGEKLYFTGKPCVRGHIAERYVSTFQCTVCITAQCKEWQSSNRERMNEWRKGWRKSNPDKQKAIDRRSYLKNKERVHAKTRNREALKRNSAGSHTAKDIRTLLAKQKGKCPNCFVKLDKYHVDHVVPLAKGGGNGPDNLQCLCPTCNIRKSDKDPLVWANENGRLL